MLDGQLMRCPNGIRVYAGLVLQGGSRIESGDIDVVDGGYIDARGTAGCPIYLTSASATPAPGDWQFHVHPAEDVETSLTWTVIEYAGEAQREAIETTASGRLDRVRARDDSQRHGQDRARSKRRPRHAVQQRLVLRRGRRCHGDQSRRVGEIVEPNIYIDAATVDGPWVHVRGNRLDEHVRWEDIGVPYLIEDFSVRARLSIEAGTEVLFGGKADLRVEEPGHLVVSGTADEPVRFGGVSENPQPGDWNRGGDRVYRRKQARTRTRDAWGWQRSARRDHDH